MTGSYAAEPGPFSFGRKPQARAKQPYLSPPAAGAEGRESGEPSDGLRRLVAIGRQHRAPGNPPIRETERRCPCGRVPIKCANESLHVVSEMKSPATTNCKTDLVRSLAPEDLRCGDFVSVLNEIGEYPSFLWDCDSRVLADDEPVRVRWRADEGGIPLRVKAICLPFVFAKAPWGRHRILDLRQCQVVRLSARYARLAWKSLSKEKTTRKTAGRRP